jgi:hypothetical protein
LFHMILLLLLQIFLGQQLHPLHPLQISMKFRSTSLSHLIQQLKSISL